MLNFNHSPQEYLPCMTSIGWTINGAIAYYRETLKFENNRKIALIVKQNNSGKTGVQNAP